MNAQDVPDFAVLCLGNSDDLMQNISVIAVAAAEPEGVTHFIIGDFLRRYAVEQKLRRSAFFLLHQRHIVGVHDAEHQVEVEFLRAVADDLLNGRMDVLKFIVEKIENVVVKRPGAENRRYDIRSIQPRKGVMGRDGVFLFPE